MGDDFRLRMLHDLRVDLSDEFDRNFERKSFFGRMWSQRRSGGRGSLLLASGRLRRSLRSRVQGDRIVFTSDAPYAGLHNEGGTIRVTAKMKRYFWARFYELSGKVRVNVRTRTVRRSSQKYSIESEYYKSLALMRVGSRIRMPERRFIGNAPEVQAAVKRVADRHFKDVVTYIRNNLKQKR
jgi:phage gpG-like protein